MELKYREEAPPVCYLQCYKQDQFLDEVLEQGTAGWTKERLPQNELK